MLGPTDQLQGMPSTGDPACTVSSRCGAGLSAYVFQLLMTMGLRRVKAAPAAATAYLTVVWGLAAGILVSGMPHISCCTMSC